MNARHRTVDGQVPHMSRRHNPAVRLPKAASACRSACLVVLLLSLFSSPGVAFEWGVTENLGTDPDLVVKKADEAGVSIVRLEISWREEDRFLSDPSHPTRHLIRGLRDKAIEPLVILGNGFVGSLPAGRKNPDADPNGYIRDLTAHVAKVVSVLKELGVRRYQIENELNAAGLATLEPFRWRRGRIWWSGTFRKRLLVALARTVRKVQPAAEIWTNFHDAVQKLPLVGTDLLKTAAEHLDGIGIDFYPNYLLSHPILGHRVGERIRWYKKKTGLPVMVLETGYPTRGYGHTVPGQNRFLQEVGVAAHQAGAAGLIYYRLFDGSTRQTSSPNPNDALEPWFGLLDADGNPKTAQVPRLRLDGWRLHPETETIIPWETFRQLIRRFR